MDIQAIKKEFPIFETNPGLVYLDSAASAQKPRSVLSAEQNFYQTSYANVHRGLYDLSEKATDMYELARAKVAKFINAEPEEIVFTGGTTDSINAVATSLYKSKLINPHPHVLLTELEHHAGVLPWQVIEDSKLEYLPVTDDFKLDLDSDFVAEFAVKPPDVVGVTHVSNVTGTMSDIKSIRQMFGNSYVVVDAAQSVAHMGIDVRDWAADFVAFSAHKLYGPTGIGVLYGKKSLLEKMEPFRVGGGMIMEVTRDSAKWANVPTKFEAGTPPIAQAVGLAAAIDFITKIGFQNIQAHEQKLRALALEELATIPGIKLFHPPATEPHAGVISFALEGIHAHDISQMLAYENIAVRAGHHCNQILHADILGVPATVRISFGVYNDESDVDKFITALKSITSSNLKHYEST
jgi:cysteine desulfurase/selenocysteine lyase